MSSQDSASPRLCVVMDRTQTASPDFHGTFSGWQYEFLAGKLMRAGFKPSEVEFKLLADIDSSTSSQRYPLIVGMGGGSLTHFTGKIGLDKWHLSPLEREGGLFLGTFDFARIQKQWEYGLYIEMTFHRAAKILREGWNKPQERFHLNPSFEETIEILRDLETKPEIAVDIETGHGQINTIGFAWSESDAIAINVLPSRCGPDTYFQLMTAIGQVLSTPALKILQNFIYDSSYLSAYGLPIQGSIFDTMWAMKVLWPEFKSGLDNVGRFYTERPYWKDDGRVSDEEGKKKNWGNIRDWTKHYTYNCRDTTGTFEASRNQRRDMDDRGIRSFFDGYLSRLCNPILEMCATGMPVCSETRNNLRTRVQCDLSRLLADFQREAGGEVNPRSPKQVINYLKGLGVKLPMKYDKERGTSHESSDASSIKKIRRKLPENKALAALQDFKSLDKALSSYIDFDLRADSRLSYSLNGAGTESLRWSGHKDPWERGFNIQTIPREGGDVSIKSMFVSPEGFSFVEIDLRQAESRFVAYDSADKTLIEMLESGDDVHTHVGNAILRQMGKDPASIPKDEFKGTWRQLGKKAGHGLNYGMKPRVFVETVFNELDIVITEKDAKLITEAYFNLFPEIPRWHSWVKAELYAKRKLSAPSGWERYFYGRPDDALKEALSWRPQHTIPWITNHLMLYLWDARARNEINLNFIAQVHDSLIFMAPDAEIDKVLHSAFEMQWHPFVNLPGGRMVIPIEAKVGKRMSELQEWHAT